MKTLLLFVHIILALINAQSGHVLMHQHQILPTAVKLIIPNVLLLTRQSRSVFQYHPHVINLQVCQANANSLLGTVDLVGLPLVLILKYLHHAKLRLVITTQEQLATKNAQLS